MVEDDARARPFLPLPGEELAIEEAMPVTNALRLKYHAGQPELYKSGSRMAALLTKKYSSKAVAKNSEVYRLPDDIMKYRMTIFGEIMEHMHPALPAVMVQTYNVLPDHPIITHGLILDHPDFAKHDSLYFSHLTTGYMVRQTNAAEVRYFFENRNPNQQGDFYIFDRDLRWVIAVSHNDIFMLTGDFKVF
ncbi:MAG: hypothetical protein AAF653_01700 [Chloroflexota bacterium]